MAEHVRIDGCALCYQCTRSLNCEYTLYATVHLQRRLHGTVH